MKTSTACCATTATMATSTASMTTTRIATESSGRPGVFFNSSLMASSPLRVPDQQGGELLPDRQGYTSVPRDGGLPRGPSTLRVAGHPSGPPHRPPRPGTATTWGTRSVSEATASCRRARSRWRRAGNTKTAVSTPRSSGPSSSTRSANPRTGLGDVRQATQELGPVGAGEDVDPGAARQHEPGAVPLAERSRRHRGRCRADAIERRPPIRVYVPGGVHGDDRRVGRVCSSSNSRTITAPVLAVDGQCT